MDNAVDTGVAVRLQDPFKALGTAVELFLQDGKFANLPFQVWAGGLAAQIRSNQYLFIVDKNNSAVGYLGWCLSDEAHAGRWLRGEAEIPYEHSLQGDCFVISAWLAHTNEANKLILRQARLHGKHCKKCVAKRYYDGGRVRAVTLDLKDSVLRHIESAAMDDGKAATRGRPREV